MVPHKPADLIQPAFSHPHTLNEKLVLNNRIYFQTTLVVFIHFISWDNQSQRSST